MSSLCVALGAVILLQLPAPQEIIRDKKNHFQVRPGLTVVVADGSSQEALVPLERLFKQIGYELPIVPASRFKAGNPAIYYGVAGQHASFENRKLRRWREIVEDYGPEGYVLAVDKKKVVALGVDEAGAFYALQTLVQLAGSSTVGWPCVQIRDWPDCRMRGAYLPALPTLDELEALAALKSNWVFFESPHFYTLRAVEAQAWAKVFRAARALHIEPVPVLPLLHGAGALLLREAGAVEGRSACDDIVLHGDDWSRLEARNVIISTHAPLSLAVSGISCRERQDYALERGELAAPYSTNNAPWLIRRVPGGRIPDGATVQARYSYAPPNSEALCPYGPESAGLLRQVLEQLQTELGARHVLIDLSAPSRLNQDLRSLAQGKSDAAVLADMAQGVARLVQDLDADMGLFVQYPHGISMPKPPKGARLLEVVSHDRDDAASGSILLVEGDGALAYAAGVRAAQGRREGIVLRGAGAQDAALRVGLEKSWSQSWPLRPWPEFYNDFFNTSLYQPSAQEVREALVYFLNEWMLCGKQGQAAWEAFGSVHKAASRAFSDDHPEVDLVYRQFRILVRYLDLEASYAAKPERSLIRKLVDLVEEQGVLDPAFGEERRERMIATIEEQELFVPSSLLFGCSLLYARPMPFSSQERLYEIPVHAVFQDERYSTSATCDFQGLPGRLCRIDFETVHAKRVVLAVREGKESFREIQTWQGKDARHGVRGPLLLKTPVSAQAFRLTVESHAETAVLRELRVFVKRDAGAARCAYGKEGGQAGFPPNASCVGGFLKLDKPSLAEVATSFCVSRDREALYIGVSAKDPRMHAMAAGLRERDAALWEEESVEVLLQAGQGKVYRFIVNPLGAQYDAEQVAGLDKAWDAGWDGVWQVGVEQDETGWLAVLAIPFKTLEAQARYGQSWGLNVIRHRNNVSKEDSAWRYDYEDASCFPLGKLIFD